MEEFSRKKLKSSMASVKSLDGRDNVSDVYNRGTSKNPDYVFNVHSPKSVDSKQPVNAIISNRNELRRYEFGGAPRKNVCSTTLSFGMQADAKYFGINLASASLLSFNIDPDNVNPVCLESAREGYAECSSGVSIMGVSYSHGYSGGDYVDQSSKTNTFSISLIGVNMTNGDVEFGMSASLLLGVSVKITSKIIKN